MVKQSYRDCERVPKLSSMLAFSSPGEAVHGLVPQEAERCCASCCILVWLYV